MGSFSYTCKLTGVPITSGEPAVLIPIKPSGKLYDNSEKSLSEYGKTCLVSNDGARLKFNPCWFPIRLNYNDYGSGEDIVKDDNTEVLEKYYNLPIETLVEIITSHRKDDGYDDALDEIKDQENPGEYGAPNYQDRYKELLNISGMWVHGTVYDELVKEQDHSTTSWGFPLDLGMPEILISFGFTEIEEDPKEARYKRQFEKDGLVVNSDGTWLHVKDTNGIYDLVNLQDYCKSEGVTIDISNHENKSSWELLNDFFIPTIDNLDGDRGLLLSMSTKSMGTILRELMADGMDEEDAADLAFELKHGMMSESKKKIAYRLLNFGCNEHSVKNPITRAYFEAVKEGKLRDVVRDFWRFDSYMYPTGRFYDIIGTSPQCGDAISVKRVLEAALVAVAPQVAQEEEYANE